MDADLFSKQVHAVVIQLSDWMMSTTPNPDRLMPAMAVVLGRLMSNRANNEAELKDMIEMATNAMTASAFEDWESRTQTQAFPH